MIEERSAGESSTMMSRGEEGGSISLSASAGAEAEEELSRSFRVIIVIVRPASIRFARRERCDDDDDVTDDEEIIDNVGDGGDRSNDND